MNTPGMPDPLVLHRHAAEVLAAGLDAIARTSSFAHDRRSRRLAVVIRPCLRARDLPPAAPIPSDAWRLLALSHRWCQGRCGARRRVLLAIYRPTLDLPGTGRLTLGCERVVDLTHRGVPGALDPFLRPADARAAVLLHQAVVDADAHDLVDHVDLPEAYFLFDADRPPTRETTFPEAAWDAARVVVEGGVAYPARMLARPAGRSWEIPAFDGSACPFDTGESDLTEGATRGALVLCDGLPIPMAPRPERVVAFLGRDRGGFVRNPAFRVLQRHGLIDPGLGYRAWLDPIARPSSKGWVVSTPDDPATPAGRFRRGLADYALADLDDRGRSARLDALMADLRHGCLAVGVVLPDEPRLAHDVLLGLRVRPRLVQKYALRPPESSSACTQPRSFGVANHV